MVLQVVLCAYNTWFFTVYATISLIFTSLHVSTLKGDHQVFLNIWCLSFTVHHSLFHFNLLRVINTSLNIKMFVSEDV
jgi:hypothetical protein